MLVQNHPIAVELLKHVKLPSRPKARMTSQTFLDDLVVAVDAQLTDPDEWESLGTEIHNWYNEAVDARNLNQNIPLFPGMTVVDVDSSIPAKKPSELKDKLGAANPPTVPKRKYGRKKVSAGQRIKEVLIQNHMKISTSDVAEKLIGEGFNIQHSTVETVCTEFRQSVRALKEAGYLENFEVK